MKSALTRLTLLAGVSLMLCVSSVPGVALAAQPRSQPTNPAQNQYLEVVPKVNGGNHTSGTAKRHQSTGTTTTPTESTTSTGASETPSTPADGSTATIVGTVHHTTKHHETKKPGKAKGKPKSAAGRRGHVLSSKPTHGATRLTVAAATGSGGGMGVWLLLILILVLVTGSAAGIRRYRRSR